MAMNLGRRVFDSLGAIVGQQHDGRRHKDLCSVSFLNYRWETMRIKRHDPDGRWASSLAAGLCIFLPL
jgi:hypothetical protein